MIFIFKCYSFSALVVRYLTKRFIGEYQSSVGECMQDLVPSIRTSFKEWIILIGQTQIWLANENHSSKKMPPGVRTSVIWPSKIVEIEWATRQIGRWHLRGWHSYEAIISLCWPRRELGLMSHGSLFSCHPWLHFLLSYDIVTCYITRDNFSFKEVVKISWIRWLYTCLALWKHHINVLLDDYSYILEILLPVPYNLIFVYLYL